MITMPCPCPSLGGGGGLLPSSDLAEVVHLPIVWATASRGDIGQPHTPNARARIVAARAMGRRWELTVVLPSWCESKTQCARFCERQLTAGRRDNFARPQAHN